MMFAYQIHRFDALARRQLASSLKIGTRLQRVHVFGQDPVQCTTSTVRQGE